MVFLFYTSYVNFILWKVWTISMPSNISDNLPFQSFYWKHSYWRFPSFCSVPSWCSLDLQSSCRTETSLPHHPGNPLRLSPCCLSLNRLDVFLFLGLQSHFVEHTPYWRFPNIMQRIYICKNLYVYNCPLSILTDDLAKYRIPDWNEFSKYYSLSSFFQDFYWQIPCHSDSQYVARNLLIHLRRLQILLYIPGVLKLHEDVLCIQTLLTDFARPLNPESLLWKLLWIISVNFSCIIYLIYLLSCIIYFPLLHFPLFTL